MEEHVPKLKLVVAAPKLRLVVGPKRERRVAAADRVLPEMVERPEPLDDYRVIRGELKAFKPELLRFPEVVALTKADLPEVREAYPALRDEFAKLDIDLHLVSAPAHDGLGPVLQAVAEKLGV